MDLLTRGARTLEINQQHVLAKLGGDGVGDLLGALKQQIWVPRCSFIMKPVYVTRESGAGRRASFTLELS